MNDTPCYCDEFDEMELHRTRVKLITSTIPAVACQTCRVIIAENVYTEQRQYTDEMDA